MQPFSFRTVPSIVVESGAARRLGALLVESFPGKTRICVVTDGFLHRSGLLDPAFSSLREHGWDLTVIDDVVADPPEHVVQEATAKARDAEVEVVLGLGGGSSMDVAKLISILASGAQTLQAIYGVGNVAGTRLPLVQMPTTAGTGSEVTAVSIVTTGAASKVGVVAPQLIADLAILDAELTVGLPRHVTAATGIDAMVHAIEAFTSARLKNPLSDLLATQALTLLSRHLLPACDQGADLSAREAMLLGAMYAGQAFANAPVAAVHALAYPIGGVFHVPHGLSNSLVLPHVMRFNAPVVSHLYAQLADIMVPDLARHATDDVKTQALIAHIEHLIEATAIPRRLREVGIELDDLPRLASDAMLQTRLLANNPKPLEERDALAIYRAAY
ncbi:Long-chain-alcohol dehydrogenase 1 [Paraburkholderia caffeinitolerans]|uniref:Long-chain-alcohol dehydrogenase 1 n=1 Tax=Paraburkholderia caffeinitolerans TaxID=1723730 RepID=A0A6J5FJ83_9BURK|nr:MULTISPECIES: iron-containing alcohol dehydrogenase [Paraburkholderia]CAB3778501.1 Long-chain-alcohol dehydrogenase 1 [Paraburkholderia caffeinitolerans]